ncbi:MAG: amino acid aldolase [Candidatus Sericytochromatia bacterium]|nr:MAG: amino acid aldolase [Candidatus Sericytochromatia bacterium]
MLANLSYYTLRELLKNYSFPLALIDLDGIDYNFEFFSTRVNTYSKKIRIATKSIRVPYIIKYIYEKNPSIISGLMCYRIREAQYLFNQGFNNIFIAYPEVNKNDLNILIKMIKSGCNVSITADLLEHFNILNKLGKENNCVINVVLELDGSLKITNSVNLGVRRSSIQSISDLKNRLSFIRNMKNINLYGVMLYEAQIAGVADNLPNDITKHIKRKIKQISIEKVKDFRNDCLEVIYDQGFKPEIINGGGSGSVDTTIKEECITEITIGSGFLCSHLFSYYNNLELIPSIFYAIEIVRKSDENFVTCMGGGYIASGSYGKEKQPEIFLPKGITYTNIEGFGEVQTPFKILDKKLDLNLGDPIILRHAKAGELAEHFNKYLVFKDNKIISETETYRGLGLSFL